MIATLKIIPYSLPGTIVEAAIAAAGGVPVFSFHPLTTRPFALIQTRMDGMKPALLTATEKVTKQRLDQLGCALVDSRVADHDAASLEVAISEAVRHGAEARSAALAISDRASVLMAVEGGRRQRAQAGRRRSRQPADDEDRRHAGHRHAGMCPFGAAERL